jgi:hypothetical protein
MYLYVTVSYFQVTCTLLTWIYFKIGRSNYVKIFMEETTNKIPFIEAEDKILMSRHRIFSTLFHLTQSSHTELISVPDRQMSGAHIFQALFPFRETSYNRGSLHRAAHSGFGPRWKKICSSPPPQGRRNSLGKSKEAKQTAAQARWPMAASAVKTTNQNLIIYDTTEKEHKQCSRTPGPDNF